MNSSIVLPFTRRLQQFDLTTPRASYVMRSLLAANLALVIAYWLELDMSYSAATTVLLVLNPVQGAVLGKGKWRLIGTLIGMGAALVLLACFIQQPWLFALADSIWLGLCVMAMSVLRHFRASGAAVAGYTIGLATLGAMQHPELGFEHAVGRASTVAVGVITLGVITALFSRRSLRSKIESLLLRLAQQTTALLAAGDAESPAHRQLLMEMYGVDDLLAAATHESPAVARQAVAIHRAMDLLLLITTDNVRCTSPCWREVTQALNSGYAGIAEALTSMQRQTGVMLSQQESAHIDKLSQVLTIIASLSSDSAAQPVANVAFHRDWPGAFRNGIRAMMTLFTAAAIWIGSGWPAGDIMLLILAPYFALLSTAPQPVAGARKFLLGTLFALPMAFICAFMVLPLINGLPLLLLVLTLFWFPGIYATSMPQTMLSGLAYLVGFNTLTAAANPMVYDPEQFLNWSLAWMIGTALTLLAFQLMPRQPQRHIARLQTQMLRSTLVILAGKQVSSVRWQQHQQHRLAQVVGLLRAQPEQQAHAMRRGLAHLNLGRALLALPKLPASFHQRQVIDVARQRIAHRARQPLVAARHAQRAARQLAAESTQLADCLNTIATLLRNPDMSMGEK